MLKSREFSLPSEDVEKLRKIEARDDNWRKRERARTLLTLHQTKSTTETALLVGIHERTVGLTKRDWVARGYESLVDRPRSGAPSKITEAQLQNIVNQARAEPSSAKQLLAFHIECGGEEVHPATLINSLKSIGFVWKRTRASLKKREMRPNFPRQNKSLHR
jgi:transposase